MSVHFKEVGRPLGTSPNEESKRRKQVYDLLRRKCQRWPPQTPAPISYARRQLTGGAPKGRLTSIGCVEAVDAD